jgi:hypothetical protein
MWNSGECRVNKQEQYRAKKRIGIALRRFLLEDYPSRRYKQLFDCDRDFLRDFVSRQFVNGMTWANFTTAWQVGHVVPLNLFDQTNREDTGICWNWANIQPISISHSRMWDSAFAYDTIRDRKRHFPENAIVDLLERRLIASFFPRENWNLR